MGVIISLYNTILATLISINLIDICFLLALTFTDELNAFKM